MATHTYNMRKRRDENRFERMVLMIYLKSYKEEGYEHLPFLHYVYSWYVRKISREIG